MKECIYYYSTHDFNRGDASESTFNQTDLSVYGTKTVKTVEDQRLVS